MRIAWLVGLVVLAVAASGAAQNYEGTVLDPFTLPYPSPPIVFEGSRVVYVTFSTSPDVVDALVPGPLETAGTTQVTVFVAEHRIVRPLALDYREAGFVVWVTHQGQAGSYWPILYLDDAYAVFPARETWGFSKVDADINIVWSPGGDSVTATVDRSGERLITIEAEFTLLESSPPTEAVGYGYNLKLIPPVSAGGSPDVCQLTRTRITSNIHGVNAGTGTLDFGRLPTDPLDDIPIYGVTDVTTTYEDLDLPFGQIVWDYLEQPGGCAEPLDSPMLSNRPFVEPGALGLMGRIGGPS